MMTRKQYRVFEYIDTFIARSGVSPSYGNIAKVLAMKSAYEAYTYAARLIAKGYLAKTNTNPPLLKVVRRPTPEELASLGTEIASKRAGSAREMLAHQRALDADNPEAARERLAYNRGVADTRARQPQTIVEAYERGVREGKRQNTVDLSRAYRDGYDAAARELNPRYPLRPSQRRA